MNDYKDALSYIGHIQRCKGRKDIDGNPIEMRMSFAEWKQMWDESGQADNRGIMPGQYVMARFEDRGHYEVGNVRICLSSENIQENNIMSRGRKRKPLPEETKEKISKTRTGQTREKTWKWTEEQKRTLSKAMRGNKNVKWTEERRKAHSEKMKAAHAKKKVTEGGAS